VSYLTEGGVLLRYLRSIGCARIGSLLFSPPDTWEGRPVLVLVLYHVLNREVGRAAENFAVNASLLPHLVAVVHLKRMAVSQNNPFNR